MGPRGDLRRALSRARRSLRPTEIEQRVAQLGLAPGALAIDCGANVGNVTLALVRRGAEVHAFDPDPDAFEVLRSRVNGVPRMHLHRQAVTDRPGKQRLDGHVDAWT
jgi:16S rRNA A1518/A1519 N6-dimethyltransferase RsmA/KsgA/DIM1 with predicted DNA glycosylase/AP lyase activity